jgi:hypothetical protein
MRASKSATWATAGIGLRHDAVRPSAASAEGRHEHAQLTALAKAHGVSLRGFIKQAVGFALDNMDGGEG